MKIVLDSSVLIYLVFPSTDAPVDSSTGKPVAHCQQRVEGMLEAIDKSAIQLVIPTPVLSELLILAGSRQIEVLNALTSKKAVQVVAFDEMAAVENAALRRNGKLRSKARSETKKEVSFDLQILAIANAIAADMVLTDDAQLARRCGLVGMKVMGIADLPLPDAKRQLDLIFGSAAATCDAGESIEGDDDNVVDEPEPDVVRLMGLKESSQPSA